MCGSEDAYHSHSCRGATHSIRNPLLGISSSSVYVMQRRFFIMKYHVNSCIKHAVSFYWKMTMREIKLHEYFYFQHLPPSDGRVDWMRDFWMGR